MAPARPTPLREGAYTPWAGPGAEAPASPSLQPSATPKPPVAWPLGLQSQPRQVILAYLGSEQEVLRGENTLTAVEAALNHLGLVCRYLDLDAEVPDADLMKASVGLVSIASQDNMPRATAMAHLVVDAVAGGKSMVFLGGLPFQREDPSGADINPTLMASALRSLGLRFGPIINERPWRLAWAPGDVPWPNFEAGPWLAPTTRLPFEALPGSQVLARVKRLDTGVAAAAVVQSPSGAVAMGLEHVLAQQPFSYKLKWRLDPHPFFKRAFKLGGLPALDPTTVNGRRVFYAHIDGDGAGNVANLPGRPLAAEQVRDEILKQTWLPTTVSFIAKEVVGQTRLEAAARSIFALPNVEPASHSYTHPFNWEAAFVAHHGQTKDSGEDEEGLRLEAEMERRLGHSAERLTPQHEIDDSVAALNRYAPPNKPVGVMLWSGRTNPTAAYLARCEALGLPNLNGGDSVVDEAYPSIAPLAPFGRRVRGFLQPYASCANENLFSNLWTGPFDGQAKAVLTFDKGGEPRRRAAANVYYHFYAGERRGGLRALKALYRWGETHPVAPIFASQYARMVEGFFEGQFATLPGDAGWAFARLGACRSVRFEGESREPDLAASEHVAGYLREGDRLWVHFSGPEGRLRWRPAGGPAQAHLAWASAPLVAHEAAPGRLKLRFQAAVRCEASLAGLPPGVRLEVEGAGWKGPDRVGADGKARFTGPAGASQLRAYWRQP